MQKSSKRVKFSTSNFAVEKTVFLSKEEKDVMCMGVNER